MNLHNPKKFSLKIFLLDVFFGGKEYKTKNAEQKTPFPLVTVALFVASTALLLIIIFSMIQKTELESEIAALKKQTISLAAKEDSLENDLNHRFSYNEILDAAKALGFSQDGGKVVYIEPKTEQDANSTE